MLGKKETEKIARLSRISLSESEEEKIRKDLSDILGYFEKLKELDTDSVSLFFNPSGNKNVFREDRAELSQDFTREQIKKQFPEKENNYLKVKEVLKKDLSN